jgi:hypothetical protein
MDMIQRRLRLRVHRVRYSPRRAHSPFMYEVLHPPRVINEDVLPPQPIIRA